MPKYDPIINDGDKVFETSGSNKGNYEVSSTVAGRVVRAYMAHRGKWPGGRDYQIGNSFWERLPVKQSEETERHLVDDAEQALLPFQEDGLLVINTIEIGRDLDGRPVLVINVTDTGTRLDLEFPVELPWEE